MATASPQRRDATEALLDAAESLLVEVGYSAITVRKLADRAGVNHGLVHYYFGSMEEVALQTLERFTDRLIERQVALYAAETPFVDKWRTAMRYLQADFDSGYQKVWFELQAMAWNHDEMRDRLGAVLRPLDRRAGAGVRRRPRRARRRQGPVPHGRRSSRS